VLFRCLTNGRDLDWCCYFLSARENPRGPLGQYRLMRREPVGRVPKYECPYTRRLRKPHGRSEIFRSIDRFAASRAFADASTGVAKASSGNCCHAESCASGESTEKLAVKRLTDTSTGSSDSAHRVTMEQPLYLACRSFAMAQPSVALMTSTCRLMTGTQPPAACKRKQLSSSMLLVGPAVWASHPTAEGSSRSYSFLTTA
jgi:hypothetical protein